MTDELSVDADATQPKIIETIPRQRYNISRLRSLQRQKLNRFGTVRNP